MSHCYRCKAPLKSKLAKILCKSCKEFCSECGKKIESDVNNSEHNYYCKGCKLKKERESAQKYIKKPKQIKYVYKKDAHLKNRYGISLDEYNRIFLFQKGKCWICGTEPKNIALAVDHKHLPNESRVRKKKEIWRIRENVRGLLCFRCNKGLQFYSDRPERLRNAALYLELHPAQTVLQKQES